MDPKFLIAICGVLQLVLLADGGWRRIVVEENMEFLEFCSIPRGEKSIHWYMTIKDKTANVVACTKPPLRATVCKQVTPIAYIDIEYGSVQNGTIWTTFLRVLRMPRELTQVKCVSALGASLENTYDINVVVPPNDTTCISTGSKSSNMFELTCSFLVYPYGTCTLSPRTLPTATKLEDIHTAYTHKHQSMQGRPLYLTTCTIRGRVRGPLHPTVVRVELTSHVDKSGVFSRLSDWISLGDLGDTTTVKSGEPDSSVIFPIVNYTVVIFFVAIAIVAIVTTIIVVRWKRKQRNLDRESQEQQSVAIALLEYPTVRGSGYPSRIVRESEYPSRTVRESEYPSRTVRESEYPSRIVRESEYPSRIMRESDYPCRTVRESEYPSRSVRESEYPSRIVRESEYPNRTVRESEYPSRIVRESDYPSRIVRESEYPSRNVRESDYPSRIVRESEYPSRNVREFTTRQVELARSDDPSRNVRECTRGQEVTNGVTNTPHPSWNVPVIRAPASDTGISAFPPSYSSIVNTSTSNDVIRPADIPAVSPPPPSYDAVVRQAKYQQKREGTGYNLESKGDNKFGDEINDLPPPYSG